ncbi:Alpha/Beta hydrolase protein [Coniochaeta sp. 2T2.1]|nr:Alpha/Beta hydrolase protein [Coniochaeta sp. 2T2.1]
MPHFQRNENISLFYTDEGEKTAPAILLIHGLTCDIHDWSWQVPFLLEKGFRVISADTRGPDADASIIDYYPQTVAYDLVALLEHLEITSVIIMAHSQGDLAAYYIATHAKPKMVRALIGMDPIHHSSNADREQTAGFFDEPAKCRDLLLMWFQYSAYTSKSPAWQKAWHQRRAMQQDSLIVHALTWGGWGDKEAMGRRENAVALFGGKLKCPRLTIGSSKESVYVDQDLLPKGSEQDEVILMEGWGHWFHQLDSETFNGHVEAWLTKSGAMPVEDA